MTGTITSASCNSCKLELGQAVHNFSTDVLKVALITGTPTGSYGATTANYSELVSNGDEVSGAGYSVGGQALTATWSLQSGVATLDFAQSQWLASSITSAGALVYNSSQGDKAVAVISFGGIFQDVNGVFLIQWPTSGAATSIFRIS